MNVRPLRLAAVAALALALTACQPSAPDAASGDANPDASIRVGLVLEPINLDIRKTAGAAIEQVLMDNVYQGLVSRTPDGTILPALASEWQVSSDALTYTFTLQPDATFHDDSPVEASDVVTSLQEVIDDAAFAGHDELAAIERVEATNEGTVTVTLAQPDANLLFSLAGPAGVIVSEGDDTDLQNAANGTGPFTLKDWRKGDSIILARDDDTWAEPAGVAEVQFSYIPDPTAAVNAATGGQLDAITIADPQFIPQLERSSDWTVRRGLSSDTWVLAFNNDDPVLSDKRVREALRLAINHDDLVSVYGAGTTLFGPIPELDPGYEDLSAVAPFDPDRARELLGEAGAENLGLELTVPSHYGTTIPTFLVSSLHDVGVTLTVNQVEFPTWINDVYTNADYQLSMVNHVEPRDFAMWANPKSYVRFDNPQVQELFATATTAPDERTADKALAKAARIVSSEHAADWLMNGQAITAVTGRVQNFPEDLTNFRLPMQGVTVTD